MIETILLFVVGIPFLLCTVFFVVKVGTIAVLSGIDFYTRKGKNEKRR